MPLIEGASQKDGPLPARSRHLNSAVSGQYLPDPARSRPAMYSCTAMVIPCDDRHWLVRTAMGEAAGIGGPSVPHGSTVKPRHWRV